MAPEDGTHHVGPSCPTGLLSVAAATVPRANTAWSTILPERGLRGDGARKRAAAHFSMITRAARFTVFVRTP